jgi:tRNA pseudouridine32 synthase/23S rRNA pseudouridine746 synthase
LKKLRKTWQERISQAREHLASLQAPIEQLKQERQSRSAQLQEVLFDQFVLLNAAGDHKKLQELFGPQIPPAGAGECAAPKLLQYAYQHQLQPLAMAEFWWGTSPTSEVRRHRQFYPACRGKCGPILPFMLTGLQVDPDPIPHQLLNPDELEILFEDDYFLVVKKPAPFLSVPGKEIMDSVQTRLQARYPGDGPFIVHRLDMATSGLMVLAKTESIHRHLQRQFMTRRVKKKYVALLDGVPDQKGGTIDLPLRVDLEDRPRQLVCFEHGKSARTHWELVAREGGNTRVHFYPVTGRTHQLRVHAAHPQGLGISIRGDQLYGQAADRLYLHAAELSFHHPISKKLMKFKWEAPF